MSTTIPPMVTAAEVSAVLPPGVSVTQATVDAVVAGIRGECGWHIAPVITETVKVDSEGGSILRLPTLNMVSLGSVRMTETNAELPVHPETGWSEAGMLTLGHKQFIPGGHWETSWRGDLRQFPAGFRAITVEFSHGYEQCPQDLARYIAMTVNQRILSETLVGRAVTFQASEDYFSNAVVLNKYRLAPRP